MCYLVVHFACKDNFAKQWAIYIYFTFFIYLIYINLIYIYFKFIFILNDNKI